MGVEPKGEKEIQDRLVNRRGGPRNALAVFSSSLPLSRFSVPVQVLGVHLMLCVCACCCGVAGAHAWAWSKQRPQEGGAAHPARSSGAFLVLRSV
eukprot:1643332-Rhodomonas_salina.3